MIPSKIFEAMAMGLPIVIAAPDGEATEIVAGEKAGIVVPPENPPALTEAFDPFSPDGLKDSPLRRWQQHPGTA